MPDEISELELLANAMNLQKAFMTVKDTKKPRKNAR